MDEDHGARPAGRPGLTREEAFLERWHQDRAIYEAWGAHVTETIRQAIGQAIAPEPTSLFIRVPAHPRCKADQKLVEKAFFRKKGYADPYGDITDKVGTRFVVLLGSDVKRVARIVEAIEDWTTSKDRDYEEEQRENPIAFDYAAVHFIVRPRADTQTAHRLIPALTPCEVQIKTLLQHAYSELTHDTIYKPQVTATAPMRRNAAKAMALLEATNDYFEKVAADVTEALANVRSITGRLSTIYRESTGRDSSPTLLEGLLLQAYETDAGEDLEARVRALLANHSHLIARIQQRADQKNPLFQQPSIFLPYLDIERRKARALRSWPLTPDEMEPLLNDFGESVN